MMFQRSSNTFIEDSITPVDVPAVQTGPPALLYIDNSITPDDVPALYIEDSIIPDDVTAVLTGVPAPL